MSCLKNGKKFVSALIALAFFITNTLTPAPMLHAAVEVPSFLSSFKIPDALGKIGGIHRGVPASPVLIHIQEAHANYDAQKNIQGILEHLSKDYGVKLVLVEGAANKLHPELLNFFPKDPALNRAVIDDLMKAGELTGAEAHLIQQASTSHKEPQAFELYGVENAEAYRKDREAYRKVYAGRNASKSFLSAFYRQWQKLADRSLNKPLRKFLDRKLSFEEERSPLNDWLTYLKAAALSNLELDLEDVQAQKEWPALIRYFRLKKIGSQIDPVKARKEQELFFSDLKRRKISGALLQEITALLEAKSSGDLPLYKTRFVFERLMDALPENYSFDPYPVFRLYAQQQILLSELQSEAFHSEIQRMADKISRALVKTEAERSLYETLHEYALLKKLFQLELGRVEFTEIQSRGMTPEKMARRIKWDAAKGAPTTALFEEALDFYRGAIEREGYMLKEARKIMSEKKADRAVMITGGFHTEGLREKTLSEGSSYVGITPNLGEITAESEKHYLTSLLGSQAVARSQIAAIPTTAGGEFLKIVSPRVWRRELASRLARIRDIIRQRIAADPSKAAEKTVQFEGKLKQFIAAIVGVSTTLQPAQAVALTASARSETRGAALASFRSEARSPDSPKKEEFPFNFLRSVTWTQIIEALEWLGERKNLSIYEKEIRRMTMMILDRVEHMCLNSTRDFSQYPDDLAIRGRRVSEKLLAGKSVNLKRPLKELITALPYAFNDAAVDLRSALWGIAEDLDERTLKTKFARELRSALHGPALSKRSLEEVRAYGLFLETGEWGEALQKQFIVREANDLKAHEETQAYLGRPEAQEKPQVYDDIVQLEEALTILFEGTFRSDIFKRWLEQPAVVKYPKLRDALERIHSIKVLNFNGVELPPHERLQKNSQLLMLISQTRELINEILNVPETPASETFDLYHLDRSLGETLSLQLSFFYNAWDFVAADKTLIMRESANVLASMMNDLFMNGFISRYVVQWAYLLASPELTLSQLADVLRALQQDVSVDFNIWQRRYYDEGHELFDGAFERIERVLARLKRERFATRAIIDLTERLKKLVDLEINRIPNQAIRPLEAARVKAEREADHYREIVHFNEERRGNENNLNGRMLYGGKANYLIHMSFLVSSVPSGFVVPYYVGKNQWHRTDKENFRRVVLSHLSKLEEDWSSRTGTLHRFGVGGQGPVEPLFLSIRSGSVFIMPGVFETAVAVGFTRDNLETLIAKRGGKAAYSAYLNFIESMAMGLEVPREKLEKVIKDFFDQQGVKSPKELDEYQTKLLVEKLMELLRKEGVFNEFEKLLSKPFQQLFILIDKIFKSWNSPKAIRYRKEKKFSKDWYTPISIQAYVFGDADERSGTGILRTHDVVTGEKKVNGDWSPMTEGFYHVQGRVKPLSAEADLKASLPKAYQLLEREVLALADYFGGSQLVEYTIQSGTPWLLQTQRDRTHVSEISFPEADLRGVSPVAEGITVYGKGAYRGVVVFKPEDILLGSVTRILREDPNLEGVILLKTFITPEDSPALINANNVLMNFGKNVAVVTSRGGSTSHAAVVANIEKIPTIVGADALDFRKKGGMPVAMFLGNGSFEKGCLKEMGTLTLDLGGGRIYEGELPLLSNAKKGQSRSEVRTVEVKVVSASRSEARFWIVGLFADVLARLWSWIKEVLPFKIQNSFPESEKSRVVSGKNLLSEIPEFMKKNLWESASKGFVEFRNGPSGDFRVSGLRDEENTVRAFLDDQDVHKESNYEISLRWSSSNLYYLTIQRRNETRLPKQKILVVGASGAVGGALLGLLQGDPSLAVTGTGNTRRGADNELIHLDITKEEQVKKLFAGDQTWDAVILAAAVANPEQAQEDPERARRVNVEAVKRLLEYYRGKSIYLSTARVFGEQGERPVMPADETSPLGIYGQTKADAEKLVLERKENVVLRLEMVYGTGDPERDFVAQVIQGLDQKREMRFDNEQLRRPVWVGDIGRAVREILERNITGIQHLTGLESEAVTKFQWAKLIAKLYYKNLRVKPQNYPNAQAFAEAFIKPAALGTEYSIPQPTQTSLMNNLIEPTLREEAFRAIFMEEAVREVLKTSHSASEPDYRKRAESRSELRDVPEVTTEVQELVEKLRALGQSAGFIAPEMEQEKIVRVIRENQVIYFAPPLRPDYNYDAYERQLTAFAAEKLGPALKEARSGAGAQENSRERKVFILRGMVNPGTSKAMYETIKWNAHPEGSDDLDFDVVFQPDFAYVDLLSKEAKEPAVVFGLMREDDGKDRAFQEKTQTVLERIFEKIYGEDYIRYVGVRSAEMSKEALIIYLAAKLAHFDDDAELARASGADISAVAFGAGLDKRIRTLFTNPSLGFGGRLYVYLQWIYAQRLHKAVQNLDISIPKNIEDPQKRYEYATAYIADKVSKVVDKYAGGKDDAPEALKELEPELHLLLYITTILRVNRQNIVDFFETIKQKYERTYGNLSGKKVALLSVSHSAKNERITASPELLLIEGFVRSGVRQFTIAEPSARAALEKWLEEMKLKNTLFENVRFSFVDSIYEAAASTDLSIIPTDSNHDLGDIDLTQLSSVLNGNPLFDGMNIFGLRADGTCRYKLEDVRAAGINLLGVGRVPLGPKWDPQTRQPLQDSAVIRSVDDYAEQLRDRKGTTNFEQQTVAVIGGGYVGLVTAALMASLGHRVHVVDLPEKEAEMAALNEPQKTKVPIYEPGLEKMIIEGKRRGLITFSTDKKRAIEEASIVYLAVGTPTEERTGEANLKYILNAASDIGEVIKKNGGPKTIVVKSTVPPNTFEEMDEVLSGQGLTLGTDYAIVSNPEFLREGNAISDVTKPDRTVFGFYAAMKKKDRERAEKEILELWFPLMKNHPHAVLLTDTASSTEIKYLANSFLSNSITGANILAEAADFDRADIMEVIWPLQRDPRIGGDAFLSPGVGYGGSCFPKDSLAILTASERATGHSLPLVYLTSSLNDYFKTALVGKMIKAVSPHPRAPQPLTGKTVTMLGMAFKAGTDDMREASSTYILHELLVKGARQIRIHDPILSMPDAPDREIVIGHFLDYVYKTFQEDEDFKLARQTYLKEVEEKRRKEKEESLTEILSELEFFKKVYFQNFLDARRVQFVPEMDQLETTDVLFLVTDWAQYKNLDLARFRPGDGELTVVDGRNIWYSRRQEIAEFAHYIGIGTTHFIRRSELRAANGGAEKYFKTMPVAETLDYASPVHAKQAIHGMFSPFQQMRHESDWGTFDYRGYRKLVLLAKKVGQKFIQELPPNQSSAANSPYSVASSKALDPNRISIEDLVDELKEMNIKVQPAEEFIREHQGEIKKLRKASVRDPDATLKLKMKALELLWNEFRRNTSKHEDFNRFKVEHKDWLDGHMLYFELKKEFSERNPFQDWDWRNWDDCSDSSNQKMFARKLAQYREEIEFDKFVQFIVYRQDGAAEVFARKNGVERVIDVPFALDGADVWLNPKVFGLKKTNQYRRVTTQGVPAEKAYPNAQYWQFYPYDWSYPGTIPFILELVATASKRARYVRLDHALGYYRTYPITEDIDEHMTLRALGIYVEIMEIRERAILQGSDEAKQAAAKDIFALIQQTLKALSNNPSMPEDAYALAFDEKDVLRPNAMVMVARELRALPNPIFTRRKVVEKLVYENKPYWDFARLNADEEVGDEGALYEYLFPKDKKNAPEPEDSLRLGYFKLAPGEAILSKLMNQAQAKGVTLIWELLGLVPQDALRSLHRLGAVSYVPAIWGFGEGSDYALGAVGFWAYLTYSLHDSTTLRDRWEKELTREEKERFLKSIPDLKWNEADVGALTQLVHRALLFALYTSKALIKALTWQDLLGLDDTFRLNIPGEEEGQWIKRLPFTSDEILSDNPHPAIVLLKNLNGYLQSLQRELDSEKVEILSVTPDVDRKAIQIVEVNSGEAFQIDAYVQGKSDLIEKVGAVIYKGDEAFVFPMKKREVLAGLPEAVSMWSARLEPVETGSYTFKIVVTGADGGTVESDEGTLTAVEKDMNLNPLSEEYVLKSKEVFAVDTTRSEVRKKETKIIETASRPRAAQLSEVPVVTLNRKGDRQARSEARTALTPALGFPGLLPDLVIASPSAFEEGNSRLGGGSLYAIGKITNKVMGGIIPYLAYTLNAVEIVMPALVRIPAVQKIHEKAALSVLGLSPNIRYAFVLGPDLALRKGMIILAKIFKESSFAILVKDPAMIEKAKRHLQEQGLQDRVFLMAHAKDAENFQKQGTVSVGLISPDELWLAEELKKALKDLQVINERQRERFLNVAGQYLRSIVESAAAQFATLRSA